MDQDEGRVVGDALHHHRGQDEGRGVPLADEANGEDPADLEDRRAEEDEEVRQQA
jgi:hypothetical protein